MPMASVLELINHVRLAHPERKYMCPEKECFSFFRFEKNLIEHQRSHSGRRDFVCKICHKAFIRENTLRIHEVKHQIGKPFMCGVPGCEAGYTLSLIHI